MDVRAKIKIDQELLEQLRQYDPRLAGQVTFNRLHVTAIIFWMIKHQVPLSPGILARAGKKAIYQWIKREWGSYEVGIKTLYLEFVRTGKSWRSFRTMAEDKIKERMRKLTRHGLEKPTVASIAMSGDYRFLQTLCHKYPDETDPMEAALRDWAILQNDARQVRLRLPQGLRSDSVDQFFPEIKALAKEYQLDAGKLVHSLRAASRSVSYLRTPTPDNLLILAAYQLNQLRPGTQLEPKKMAVALPGAQAAIATHFGSMAALEAAAHLLRKIRRSQTPR